MEKIKKMVFGIILFSLILFSGCKNQQNNENSLDEYVIDENDFVNGEKLIEDIPISNLNEYEINGLILMREEEKLARDVYKFLGAKWNMRIFENIANSEQTHTNAIKTLLDKYGIEDPVKNNEIGVFTSLELKNLYENLIKQGSNSLLDALIIGATVEDLDIKDLNELSNNTDKEDILIVYNNLNRGSRNHLRAFVKQINKDGENYLPKYITQTEFDNIISSQQEKGR